MGSKIYAWPPPRIRTRQQIEKTPQNKKASQFVSLLICNNIMAGALSQSRNTIFPSLILMYEKLQKLGLAYEDGRVVYIEPELEVRNVRAL